MPNNETISLFADNYVRLQEEYQVDWPGSKINWAARSPTECLGLNSWLLEHYGVEYDTLNIVYQPDGQITRAVMQWSFQVRDSKKALIFKLKYA